MNVGAKIFGSPSGEPKHHNQTNAQKKCEKLLTLPSPFACTPRVDGPQGDFYNSQRADLCPLPSIDYTVDFGKRYLMKSVSRSWSRLTYDFIVRNLPKSSWISRF